MLLQSVLAELSIDVLDDDQQQQMLHVITATPAVSHAYNYASHRVLLEMCSPSDSSTELQDKPITRNEEKEECGTGDILVHLSEVEEKNNVYRAPGYCTVPFTWETQPGVPKSPQRDSELRYEEEEDQSLQPVPLKLPPTASSTASSVSLEEKAGGWNHFCELVSVQGGNINGYDGDDDEDNIAALPTNLELDSNEEWSPVSINSELPQSPRSSYLFPLTPSSDDSHDTMPSGSASWNTCTTLLWSVFPCNKCIFVTWLKQYKGKKKQPEGCQDPAKVRASTSHHGLKMILEASHPVQPISVLKNKNSRSSSCNKNVCNSPAGVKQVRFSVETDAYLSSSNDEQGMLPAPSLMDWASYGLF